MLLSIIGDLLGDDDERDDGSGGGSDDLMAGSLAGGDDDELMPGSSSGDGMGGDDLFGDDGGGDDLLGGGGGMGDVALDDGGDDGGISSEIESRVEEMENEVGSLSSTVNTVQSENEQINESLEEIEENIRKLLEVYEMVTQGVNPFVEGDSLSDTLGAGGGAAASGTGEFGGESLFDSGDGDEEEDEMSDEIANAEAEEFLDESLIDDEDDDEFETDLEDAGVEPDSEANEELSFDELKSEYESGDADWDGDEGDEDDADIELEETTEPEPELAVEPDAEDDDAEATLDDGGRPYLETIPAEYDTEFVVMNWLDYLVGEVGLDDASRTLRFYESIRWVSPEVEAYLQTILNGFAGGPDVTDPEPRSSLGVDHKRSLWWISQIATPAKKRLPFEEWVAEEGTSVRREMEAVDRDDPLEDSNEEAVNDGEIADEVDEIHEFDEALESEPDVDVADASLANPIVDADDGRSEDGFDLSDPGDEDELDLPDPEDVGDEDDGEGSGAQKIPIDEGRTGTKNPQTKADVAETVDADGEQMIWVDSDVVLSESGAELRGVRDEYGNRIEYAKPLLESGDVDSNRATDRHVKPLVIPDGNGDPDRWQVERIKLLLAPDDGTDGR